MFLLHTGHMCNETVQREKCLVGYIDIFYMYAFETCPARCMHLCLLHEIHEMFRSDMHALTDESAKYSPTRVQFTHIRFDDLENQRPFILRM